ncbi:MAG: response regulator transcription factor [Spirochaetaceae bacterium]|nr:response regulator transcription factor [Spirochaetaceae bacterium]
MPKTHHILVVEDDDDIMELIRFNCGREGFVTVAARSAEEALRLVADSTPLLILVDLMLPGMDGLALCQILKSNVLTRGVPIVMVTAKGEEADIIAGLEQGAEDYVTKPFSPRVLIARIKAVLRRHGTEVHDRQAPLTVGALTIHPGRREVKVGGRAVRLTATEFSVLQFLAGHAGWVFTRNQLVAAVHGPDYPVTDRSIDVLIAGVRKKLGAGSGLIETVRGVGYRFKDATA